MRKTIDETFGSGILPVIYGTGAACSCSLNVLSLESMRLMQRSQVKRRRFTVRYWPEDLRNASDSARAIGDVLERMSFKPHWREVRVSRATTTNAIVVEFFRDEPNSDCWDREPVDTTRLTLQIGISVKDAFQPNDVVDIITDSIKQGEMHEVDEWLRVDGKRRVEPHSTLSRMMEVQARKI